MIRVVMTILLRPWMRRVNRRLDELEARLVSVHADVFRRANGGR